MSDKFLCPACGASHERGALNGVDVYRCLKCGYVGPNGVATDGKDRTNRTNRPKIVCICGSSRFVDVSAVKAWEFNKLGIATFMMPLLPHWYPGVQEHHQAEAEGVAEALDNLWLRLIEMADEVFVVNVDGYIGERTGIEIGHARKLGKPVVYLEARQ